MLSLLFIYFLGRPFYTLALKHNKKTWLFPILGVVVYYASSLLSGVFLGVLSVLLSLGLENMSVNVLGLLTIPFGLLGCWGFYKVLEHKWNNTLQVEIETIDEIGKKSEQE